MRDFDSFADLPIELQEEAIREGEARLEAQLQIASAADARALAWGGLLTAATTASLGASLVLISKTQPDYLLAALALGFSATILVASAKSLSTVAPREFHLPGNVPQHWLPSEWDCVGSNEMKIQRARVEQAETLNNSIFNNRTQAHSKAAVMRESFDLAFSALRFGGLGLFAIISFRYADLMIVAR